MSDLNKVDEEKLIRLMRNLYNLNSLLDDMEHRLATIDETNLILEDASRDLQLVIEKMKKIYG